MITTNTANAGTLPAVSTQDPQDREVTPLTEFVTGQNTRAAANVFMWKRAGFTVLLLLLLPAMLVTCLLFPPLILAWAAGLVWFIVRNVRANRRRREA